MTDSVSPDPERAAHVREALLELIHDQALRAPNASTLLKLAEAYAWTVAPEQPHGGTTER